eukprot:CAMPEP_0203678944 /NCGR_PEP_ID=MMETSP0090-20130426/33752_1 /ASSEMBLY_ACC=CAM_ASM_001088 /TAXON_ID=426623 /ORGANISM="Chaetoceros affinis, Strain CCMP159" /LENGTH=71 /DNA_ID=CAMNT_0050546393 /DNA_START=9 /DNA_END=221 /DNA_ORIENTATION=+
MVVRKDNTATSPSSTSIRLLDPFLLICTLDSDKRIQIVFMNSFDSVNRDSTCSNGVGDDGDDDDGDDNESP